MPDQTREEARIHRTENLEFAEPRVGREDKATGAATQTDGATAAEPLRRAGGWPWISDAFHELNTPLTPLRIHVEAMIQGPGLSEAHRDHLVVIERNLLRVSQLVRDLAEASRLETGRSKMSFAVVPMTSVLGDAVAALASVARTAGVRLELGSHERLRAAADRARVDQVLNHVIRNAIRSTPPGGRVTVSARARDDEVVVRVQDTGIGLAAEQIDLLFQAFGRLAAGPEDHFRGSGLGLFISRAIVERHGGRMWAESPGRGAGASFFFTLPVVLAVRGDGPATGGKEHGGNGSRPS